MLERDLGELCFVGGLASILGGAGEGEGGSVLDELAHLFEGLAGNRPAADVGRLRPPSVEGQIIELLHEDGTRIYPAP